MRVAKLLWSFLNGLSFSRLRALYACKLHCNGFNRAVARVIIITEFPLECKSRGQWKEVTFVKKNFFY